MEKPIDLSGLGSHIVGGQEYRTNASTDTDRIESINPFSGELLWSSGAADQAMVDAAVNAARSAFLPWARMGLSERHQLLSRFVELVKAETHELTQIIAMEAGKPLWESKAEVNSLVSKLAASVDAYRVRASESSREVRGLRSRTRFLPHGVMAVLGPFNFPASMANSHLMPALLAGNTVVFKPSELTSITGLLVSRLWQKAGIPSGVLNCVTGGRQTGEHLIGHSDIDGVLFVGSHRAGLSILKKLAESPEKVIALEMGGNSPLVIWDYDDIDVAVHTIIQSAFMSAGQRCSAARRLLIREDDTRTVKRLVQVLQKLKIGDFTTNPEPYYGPLIRPGAANAVMARTKQLVDAGAREVLAPVQQGPIGTLIGPGLIDVDGCTDDRDEEIFGPILKIQHFKDFPDAIRLANNTIFGLAAGIVCREREQFEEFFHLARAGIINWNQQLTGATTLAPFGGIKQSGNFRPAGFLSADYCSYPIASFEVDAPRLPDPPVPGIDFH
jgi:succinylglutamic semialdehyde dehydrogenase